MKTRQLIIITGLMIAAVLPTWPASVQAQVTRIVVRVDGLSCPFCAYSLEKRIKRIDAVGSLAIEVDDGLAIITPSQGKRIDVHDLPEAVKKAGFTPREIRVEATAKAENLQGRLTLVAEDGTPLFLLEANEISAGLTTGDGTVYRITGTVVSQDKEKPVADHPTLALIEATSLDENKDE